MGIWNWHKEDSEEFDRVYVVGRKSCDTFEIEGVFYTRGEANEFVRELYRDEDNNYKTLLGFDIKESVISKK